MLTIIQISDFHIKTSMGDPEHNTAFTKMVDKIKTLRKNSNDKLIIVYNGDIIDNTYIYNLIKKLPDTTTSAEKALFWENKAKEEYTLAKQYFDYMLTNLDISAQHLILCCGNHDVNTWYNTDEKEIDCPHGNKRSYFPKRFDLYDDFLKQLRIDTSRKSCTYFVTVEGINFLVANSNWVNKFDWPNNLCIDCKSISELILTKQSQLLRNVNKNKYKNVFVAHAPISDYCEEARLGFEKNKYSPITDKLDDLFGLQLFGDKHTEHDKGAEHIVGAPLDSNRITCVAHQYTDDNKYLYRTLTYKKGEDWEFTKTDKYSEKILNISEKYIKEKAKEYLFGSVDTNTLDMLKNFEIIRANPKWRALDALFRASSSVREPDPKGGSGKQIPIGSDFINTITRLITASDSKVSVMVRGGVRLGKSVCMSVLYLNMLYRFSCGSFEYIPIYINLESLLQEITTKDSNRDSVEYYEEVLKKVSEFLKQGQELCESYEYEGCCIIDGLNKYCYYRNAKIETGIMSLLNQEENDCYKRRVFCIDTDNDATPKGLEYTDFHKNKDARYLVYFDPVLTYKDRIGERYDTFVDACCALRGLVGDEAKETANTIKDNVSRMGILELDMNMMNYFWDQLCIPGNNESYFTLLEKFVRKKLTRIDDNITKANYLISVEGRGYSDIRRICSINNNTFDLLRTQPAIAQYLHARFYVETANKYLDSSYPKENIPRESCLNQLLDHKICTLVREYISENNLDAMMLEFSNSYYDCLRNAGKATLTYLVGRLKHNREDISHQLDMQKEMLEKYEKETKERGESIDNYMRVAERSIAVSRMFIYPDSHKQQKAILEYVRHLISHENDRKINRRFHLLFYSDRGIEETSLNTDRIYSGFDIYCTYHILYQRIQKQLETTGAQRLLALELFTLCDLIQLRIDNPIAYYKDKNEEKETESFFYKEKYNFPKDSMAFGIITNMRNIVYNYLERYKNSADDLFIEYLKHQLDTYDKILPILEKGPLTADNNKYRPEAFLHELVKLEETKRMGWLFHELFKTIPKKQFLNKRNSSECHETTLQHVFEMYVIGMLYLPKESDHVEYDKKTILDLIMIHDLGESHTGDSIKAYESFETDKDKEKEWCRNLYLQGVHEGVADLTEYGRLWDQWNDQDNPTYNVKVAKDIDRLQLLYKLSILVTQKPPVYYSKNRFQDFWKLANGIRTNEAIRIYNTLIAGNSEFVKVAEKNYEIQVIELPER